MKRCRHLFGFEGGPCEKCGLSVSDIIQQKQERKVKSFLGFKFKRPKN